MAKDNEKTQPQGRIPRGWRSFGTLPGNNEERISLAEGNTLPPERTGKTFSPGDGGATLPPGPGKDSRTTVDFSGRLARGTVIGGRYEINRFIGQGGMGVVYLCRDKLTSKDVALKTLLPESGLAKQEIFRQLQKNFALISDLHHSGIADCNDLVYDENLKSCFLQMEYVDGDDLRTFFDKQRKNGTFSIALVLKIFGQLASALDYAHRRKILHRDIKPANIMVDRDGNVKLLDFGIAAELHTTMTRMSGVGIKNNGGGTRPYMAPELLKGQQPGKAADQYALAVTLYEILSGHLPFDNPDPEIFVHIVTTQKAPLLKGVPKTVRNAVARALSKDPKKRFDSCSDFVSALGKKGSTLKMWLLMLVLLAAAFSKFFVDWGNLAQVQKSFSEVRTPVSQQIQVPPEVPEKTTAAAVETEPSAKSERPDRELYIRYALETRKKFLEKSNCDRGQTFGTHLDQFFYNLEAGELAYKDKNFPAAAEYYRQAKKADEWIEKNMPLRRQVRELLAEVRKKIEKLRGLKEHPEFIQEMARIEKEIAAVLALFETGEFEKTAQRLREIEADCEKLFTRMHGDMLKTLSAAAEQQLKEKEWEKVKATAAKIALWDQKEAARFAALARQSELNSVIEKKLAAAYSRRETENWYAVLALAKEILALDGKCEKALALKEEAEMRLMPTLEIEALVNNRLVLGKIIFEENLPVSQADNLFSLERGKTYICKVTYRDLNSGEYAGEKMITANWIGFKKEIIELKKIEPQKSPEEAEKTKKTTLPETQKRSDAPKKVKAPEVPAAPAVPELPKNTSFSIKLYKDACVIFLPPNHQLRLIKIAPDSFVMGSPSKEVGREANEMLRRVKISKPFWIGCYEVTQAQWKGVMGNNPAFFRSPDRPVENVSWLDARGFCNKLNDLFAKQIPVGYRFDLPSEQEWEFSCRAGTMSALNNGQNLRPHYSLNNSPQLDPLGWYIGNCGVGFELKNGVDISGIEGRQYKDSFGGTHPVGRKRPNVFGLYDMHGNVWEWCRDTGKMRLRNSAVCRGGAWNTEAVHCRSAERRYARIDARRSNLGFRLVLTAEKK